MVEWQNFIKWVFEKVDVTTSMKMSWDGKWVYATFQLTQRSVVMTLLKGVYLRKERNLIITLGNLWQSMENCGSCLDLKPIPPHCPLHNWIDLTILFLISRSHPASTKIAAALVHLSVRARTCRGVSPSPFTWCIILDRKSAEQVKVPKSYYNLSSVCGRVCPETTPAFMGRGVSNLAGRSRSDTKKIWRGSFPWKQLGCHANQEILSRPRYCSQGYDFL